MAESDYQRAEEKFRDFLAGKGLRLTAPRRAVLRAVMEFDAHFGRNRLLGKLKGTGAHRATMFRALPLLVEAGIVRRMRERLDHWHYERVVGREHHDHLLCVACGRVIEFTSPAIEREQRRLCKKHDFEETTHSFIVRGQCSRCRKKSKDKNTRRKVSKQ
jgi:Fur family transcriptional regulator, ferric uptake regulator